MSKIMKSICVFCGSSDGNDPLITKAAIALADAAIAAVHAALEA